MVCRRSRCSLVTPYKNFGLKLESDLNQIVNHFAAVNDWHRSAERSEECAVGIDTHQDRNRAEQIVDTHRISGWCCGMFVGLSDHLTGFRAAAGKDDRLGHRPVIASSLRIDPRRPAHFSHHHDQRFIQQSALFQVCDQCAERAVGVGDEIRFQAGKTIEVYVPAWCIDTHKTAAAFDQSSRQQGTLSQLCATIGVSYGIRLGVNIERFSGVVK